MDSLVSVSDTMLESIANRINISIDNQFIIGCAILIGLIILIGFLKSVARLIVIALIILLSLYLLSTCSKTTKISFDNITPAILCITSYGTNLDKDNTIQFKQGGVGKWAIEA